MKSGEIFLKCVVSIEHGYICIRNRAGWLLWSVRDVDLDPDKGVVLADIESELIKNQLYWEKTCIAMGRSIQNE